MCSREIEKYNNRKYALSRTLTRAHTEMALSCIYFQRSILRLRVVGCGQQNIDFEFGINSFNYYTNTNKLLKHARRYKEKRK